MLAWMRFSGSSQSLYLEECLICTKGYREEDELMCSCGLLTVVDWLKWTKAEDAIWIVKLLKKKCSFAVYMDFMLPLLILLLHFQLLVWHKIRIVSNGNLTHRVYCVENWIVGASGWVSWVVLWLSLTAENNVTVFWRRAAAGGGVCTSSSVVLWLGKKHRLPYCQCCFLHRPFLVSG